MIYQKTKASAREIYGDFSVLNYRKPQHVACHVACSVRFRRLREHTVDCNFKSVNLDILRYEGTYWEFICYLGACSVRA